MMNTDLFACTKEKTVNGSFVVFIVTSIYGITSLSQKHDDGPELK